MATSVQSRMFRLVGIDLPFRLVREFKYLGEIPCVYGVTLDGKRQTTARVADIRWLS